MKNKFENIDDRVPFILYPYFLGKRYKDITGNSLNLFFPRTLSEKVQWLKLFDSTPLKGLCADKVAVRDYFCKKIVNGADYLKKVFGVWDDFDDIDFDSLPSKFILKLNHGCGFNSFIINKEKMLEHSIQFNSLRERINLFYNTRYYLNSLELHYKFIKPQIFAEEIIGGDSSLLFNDWMVYCFNGEPKFCNYIAHFKDGFDYSFVNNEKFQKLDFSIAYKTIDANLCKPYNYEKMFELASILSKDFKFVRVDFIEFDKKLYFAELTFTPYSGYFRYNGLSYTDDRSKKIDLMLGDMLII